MFRCKVFFFFLFTWCRKDKTFFFLNWVNLDSMIAPNFPSNLHFHQILKKGFQEFCWWVQPQLNVLFFLNFGLIFGEKFGFWKWLLLVLNELKVASIYSSIYWTSEAIEANTVEFEFAGWLDKMLTRVFKSVIDWGKVALWTFSNITDFDILDSFWTEYESDWNILKHFSKLLKIWSFGVCDEFSMKIFEACMNSWIRCATIIGYLAIRCCHSYTQF